jgi:hypothetical protein
MHLSGNPLKTVSDATLHVPEGILIIAGSIPRSSLRMCHARVDFALTGLIFSVNYGR